MKIKRDQWHWKYIAERWDRYPVSFCSYFRKIVVSIFIMLLAGIVGSAAVGVAASVALFPIWQFFLDLGIWNTAMFVFSTSLYVMAAIFIPYKYRIYLYETGELERKPRPVRIKIAKPKKEPGLVRQYLTAQHRKICPLLDYEDSTADYCKRG